MFKAALKDILFGLGHADLWMSLGWYDVKQRYRRSVIGPFWITIATTVMVVFMSIIYAGLFRMNVLDFLPFVACGMIIWGLIASCLTEGARVFIEHAPAIKQLPAPLTVHVYRLIWQQLITMGHNIVVIAMLILVTGMPLNINTLMVIPGLLLLIINITWLVLLVGIIGARFRDVPLIIQTLVPALFLITPIMWHTDLLPPGRRWVAEFNPFMHLIEIVRIPSLGGMPSINVLTAALLIAIVGWSLTIFVYARVRGQIAYWI